MKTTFLITTAGAEALGRLNRERPASVLGETSRGIFLRLPADEVVFISRESWRGPLTANAPGLPHLLLEPGDEAETAGGRIWFEGRDIDLSLGRANAWLAAPVEARAPRNLALERLRSLSARLLAEKDGSGLSGLLADLLGLPAQEGGSAGIETAVREARAALAGGHAAESAGLLAQVLGHGSGLTPSGDDFILGMLLAGSAAGRELQKKLAGPLAAAALERTTTLSANLIACAAAGQADERLMRALDGLVGDEFDLPAAAAGLASWGSSSGLDALAGMAFWLATLVW